MCIESSLGIMEFRRSSFEESHDAKLSPQFWGSWLSSSVYIDTNFSRLVAL